MFILPAIGSFIAKIRREHRGRLVAGQACGAAIRRQ
jgi:hypothetical protein